MGESQQKMRVGRTIQSEEAASAEAFRAAIAFGGPADC